MRMSSEDRVIVEILSRSNKKELATLHQLMGKWAPHLPFLDPEYKWAPTVRKGMDEEYKKIGTLGKKYYGEKLEMVWREKRERRYKNFSYGVRNQMPKLPKQDNKKTYIGGGGGNRNSIRYPSLKRSKTTWRRFYELFPSAERRKEV